MAPQRFKRPAVTPVVVTGMAGFSSLGDLASTWHKLLNGESGLRLQQPFPQFPLKPLGMLHSAPRSLEQIIPEVVQQTLKDAQLTTPLPDCGIVVGSSRAQQGKLETFASQVSQGASSLPRPVG